MTLHQDALQASAPLRSAVITIGLDPDIQVGPLSVSWHGLTIAIGIMVGALAARRWADERSLTRDPLYTLTALVAVAGIVGGRLLYLAEHGGALLGTRGFTFDGGVILAAPALAVYVWRSRVSASYLDAVAAGLPLGIAIGRVGDVINGEHYGAASDFFLAVRNSSPHSLTPDPSVAYQNGGVYEVLLALAIFAVVWPLRHRMRSPGGLAWCVLFLFSFGRFFEFFLRSDSPSLALGLDNAQWTSIALALVSLAGWRLTHAHVGTRPLPRPDRAET